MWLRRVASRRFGVDLGGHGLADVQRAATRRARGAPAAGRDRFGSRPRRRPRCRSRRRRGARCRTPGRRPRGRRASARARRSRLRRRRIASTGWRPPSNSATTGTSGHPRRGVAVELVRRSLERRVVATCELRRGAAAAERALRARLVALDLHRQVVAGAVDAHVLRRGRVLDEVVRACRTCRRAGTPRRPAARAPVASSALAISASRRGRPSVSTVSNRCSSARIVFSIISRLRAQLRDTRRPSRGSSTVDEPVEERLGQAEVLAVAHRAAHDLAQHVAAPLVRRDDAVGDQERRRADVVGDDAHRDVALAVARRSGRRRARRSAASSGVNRSVS